MPVRDVSEQYVSPPRSLRLLLTYVGRFGLSDALLKVRSRLSERGRNRKAAALIQGLILEGPAGKDFETGTRVWAFEGTHLRDFDGPFVEWEEDRARRQ